MTGKITCRMQGIAAYAQNPPHGADPLPHLLCHGQPRGL